MPAFTTTSSQSPWANNSQEITSWSGLRTFTLTVSAIPDISPAYTATNVQDARIMNLIPTRDQNGNPGLYRCAWISFLHHPTF